MRQNPSTFRGRIIQDLPALKQLDGIDVSKMEKIEAGFQVSSSEEEGSEESDDEFDINDEPYRQRIAQSEGENILREVKRSLMIFLWPVLHLIWVWYGLLTSCKNDYVLRMQKLKHIKVS